MPRRITVLIVVSDDGAITIDARGPVNGTDGLKRILQESIKLTDQGHVVIK